MRRQVPHSRMAASVLAPGRAKSVSYNLALTPERCFH